MHARKKLLADKKASFLRLFFVWKILFDCCYWSFRLW